MTRWFDGTPDWREIRSEIDTYRVEIIPLNISIAYKSIDFQSKLELPIEIYAFQAVSTINCQHAKNYWYKQYISYITD